MMAGFDITNLLPVGSAQVGGATIASQTLTVSTAAVACTSFAIPDTQAVVFDVVSQPVRVRWDGTAPTSTVGHVLYPAVSYMWLVNMFNAAKFIRDTSATGDATIFASPLRQV